MSKLILFLLLVSCSNPKYPDTKIVEIPKEYNEEQLDRYLIQEYSHKEFEYLSLVLLKDNKIIDIKTVAVGDKNHVSTKTFNILAECLKVLCNKLIMDHNHPNKYFANPSFIDIDTSKYLFEYLKKSDIKLISSIIITEHDTYWIKEFEDDL